MTVQFERGTVWQRDVGQFDPGYVVVPPPVRVAPPIRGRRAVVPLAPAPSPVALGTTAFDGLWSVVIMTDSGPCDRAYRYGVRINDGFVSSDAAGGVALQGRVAPNGSVRVGISAGGIPPRARAACHPDLGSGTWHGQGSGASYVGTWQAERRG